MKTFEQQFEEMADPVIKLVWGFTIFRALFEKNTADCETRAAHPEFFLTLDEFLISGFCIKAAIVFETKEKQLSLCNLINEAKKVKPDLARGLAEKVDTAQKTLAALETLRNQVIAHLSLRKETQKVYKEAKIEIGMMHKTTELAKSIILDLASVISDERRALLESQQLSNQTLQIIADDSATVVGALV